MKKRVLSQILALAVLTPSLVRGQQTVAPPPKGTAAASDLAVTMKNLEEKLRSTGRVNWTQTTQNTNTHAAVGTPQTYWTEITNVMADPNACQLKIQWQTSWGASVSSVYLEEVSSVEVLTSQEAIHRALASGSQTEVNDDPQVFFVVVNSWDPFYVIFQTREAAEQAASLLRENGKQCSAVQVSSQQPTGSGPGLDETLAFIADKLWLLKNSILLKITEIWGIENVYPNGESRL